MQQYQQPISVMEQQTHNQNSAQIQYTTVPQPQTLIFMPQQQQFQNKNQPHIQYIMVQESPRVPSAQQKPPSYEQITKK